MWALLQSHVQSDDRCIFNFDASLYIHLLHMSLYILYIFISTLSVCTVAVYSLITVLLNGIYYWIIVLTASAAPNNDIASPSPDTGHYNCTYIY